MCAEPHGSPRQEPRGSNAAAMEHKILGKLFRMLRLRVSSRNMVITQERLLCIINQCQLNSHANCLAQGAVPDQNETIRSQLLLQRSKWKRRWKDFKNQRWQVIARTWCFLDTTGLVQVRGGTSTERVPPLLILAGKDKISFLQQRVNRCINHTQGYNGVGS